MSDIQYGGQKNSTMLQKRTIRAYLNKKPNFWTDIHSAFQLNWALNF